MTFLTFVLRVARNAEAATEKVGDSAMAKFVGETLQGVDDEKRTETSVESDHRDHL